MIWFKYKWLSNGRNLWFWVVVGFFVYLFLFVFLNFCFCLVLGGVFCLVGCGFFPFEIYLLGWLIFLQFLLKIQNYDFVFCQRNIFPEKLFSFCVEAMWKKKLKMFIEKVVSELHFVNFFQGTLRFRCFSIFVFSDWGFFA